MSFGRALAALGGVVLLGCASAGRPAPAAPPLALAPAPPTDALRAPVDSPPGPPVETVGEAPAPDAPPPTWATLYARYFAPGTEGNCASGRCHSKVMGDATAAYEWLASRGYIAGSRSPLVGANSCLRWFGGNMPPRGTPNEEAIRDLGAWAAAGAPNN
jgi:hypothetical protein